MRSFGVERGEQGRLRLMAPLLSFVRVFSLLGGRRSRCKFKNTYILHYKYFHDNTFVTSPELHITLRQMDVVEVIPNERLGQLFCWVITIDRP